MNIRYILIFLLLAGCSSREPEHIRIKREGIEWLSQFVAPAVRYDSALLPPYTTELKFQEYICDATKFTSTLNLVECQNHLTQLLSYDAVSTTCLAGLRHAGPGLTTLPISCYESLYRFVPKSPESCSDLRPRWKCPLGTIASCNHGDRVLTAPFCAPKGNGP